RGTAPAAIPEIDAGPWAASGATSYATLRPPRARTPPPFPDCSHRFPFRRAMSFTVTIRPSGHRFTVDEDDTVLAAALREGLNLPYGCRNGACGSCKGKLLAGRVDYGRYQS